MRRHDASRLLPHAERIGTAVTELAVESDPLGRESTWERTRFGQSSPWGGPRFDAAGFQRLAAEPLSTTRSSYSIPRLLATTTMTRRTTRESTTDPSPSLHEPDQRRIGRAHLRTVDPVLGALVGRIGDPWPRQEVPLFERLCGTVVSQQLSAKAASTILDRVRKKAGRLQPRALDALEDADLRACGLSRAKVASLRDLTAHVHDGRLDLDALGALDDDSVVERLTRVRGIGPWSSQMILLFGLGRRDVWATGDQGLRRALMQIDELATHPEAPAMIERAATWRPWRGLASIYLWALLDDPTK